MLHRTRQERRPCELELARALARAVLGLYNSIWQWYRPDGVVSLDFVAEFFRARLLQVIGFGPDAPARGLAA
jgi:hypothetical protein